MSQDAELVSIPRTFAHSSLRAKVRGTDIDDLCLGRAE